jgi:hypothetical protein
MVRWTLLLLVVVAGCFELDPYEPCEETGDCERPLVCLDGECIERPPPPGGEGEGCVGCCIECLEPTDVPAVDTQSCLLGCQGQAFGCNCRDVELD